MTVSWRREAEELAEPRITAEYSVEPFEPGKTFPVAPGANRFS